MFNRMATWFSVVVVCTMLGASIVRAAPPTTVTIAGYVSGNDPFPSLLRIAATVIGKDPDTLAGGGHHTVLFPSGGFAEHSMWSITEGATDGTSVVLVGYISKSTAPIEGTPIRLEADISTGALILTVGPFTDVFPGLIVTSEGFGTVVITGE